MAGLLKSLSAGTRCSDLHFVICVKVLVLVLAVQPLLMGNLQTPYTDGRITRLKVVGKSRAHVAQLLALSLALPPMRPPSAPAPASPWVLHQPHSWLKRLRGAAQISLYCRVQVPRLLHVTDSTGLGVFPPCSQHTSVFVVLLTELDKGSIIATRSFLLMIELKRLTFGTARNEIYGIPVRRRICSRAPDNSCRWVLGCKSAEFTQQDSDAFVRVNTGDLHEDL